MPFHLRFTPQPKGLAAITNYDISGALARATRYIVAYETKDKSSKDTIPHYHVWIDTDVCEKTLRTSIVKGLSIPVLTRGKTNGYYSLQEWSDPAYICKQGCVQSSKGYTPAEVQEYVEQGKQKFMRVEQEVRVAAEGRPASEASGTRSDELWEIFLEEVIPKDLAQKAETYTIQQFRWATLKWFRDRGNGKFNLSTYKQFMVCGWLQVDLIRRRAISCTEVDLERYGI